MNYEMQLIWQELQADLATPAFAWQLGIIVTSLLLAWSVNGLLRAYVMRRAPETWKVAIGGINRVLFPLSSLLFVCIGKVVLSYWHHTSMLKLAVILLAAMAVIRLAVYGVRFIFAPGGWLKTMESAISTTVWLMLALHLSGLLPQLVLVLEDVSFNIGKSPVNLLQIFQALLTILVTLFIALWFSRILENKLMRSAHLGINMRVVLSKLVRIALSFIAILMALSAVGLDITLLSVFGGALGVGLGFGLQKIASNYVSGFIILTDKSMQIGDVITIDNHYGVIDDLRSRYMVLRKLDGTQVIIPNENLITNPVINHSLAEHKARVQLFVQVSYESPLKLAMQLMREAADKQPRVLVEPKPEPRIEAFGESGIDLSLNIWIPDPEEGSAALRSAIYLDIWEAFQANGISIPYPQREIRILGTVHTRTGDEPVKGID
jgi:small-conductance mechanosensitive channel